MEHSDLVKSTLDRSQREIVEIIGRETTIAKHGAIEPIADRHLDIFDALLAAYILRVDYAKVIEPGERCLPGFTPRRNVRFDNGIPEPPQSIDQVGVGTLARVRTGDPEQIVRGEADGSRRRATPVEEIRHDARDVEQDLLVVDRRDPVFPRRHLNAHAFGLKRHGGLSSVNRLPCISMGRAIGGLLEGGDDKHWRPVATPDPHSPGLSCGKARALEPLSADLRPICRLDPVQGTSADWNADQIRFAFGPAALIRALPHESAGQCGPASGGKAHVSQAPRTVMRTKTRTKAGRASM
ncbi:hypothetical protein COLO4_02675 [Corchorus olitorius]|uniref:Uncharacterized protein n=1 Tax=Corchorus olitorius TaxID=93759 RepID=A0A1R3L0I1_9ROSI|nr:hypothetical protein COLO4_02675 [Corchorus olitorius]